MPYESSRLDPQLSADRRSKLSGLEPALSRDQRSLYGRFHIPGLEAPRVAPRRRPLVIYADMDHDSMYLIGQVAYSNGYQVMDATSSTDAICLVTSSPPDMVVVNTNIGLQSTLDTVKCIRSSNDSDIRTAPVLVLESIGQLSSIQKIFAAGADDVLVAPYELSQLLRAWRRNSGFRRDPAPLTAFQSEQQLVREIALGVVIDHPSDGLLTGLNDLLDVPDSTVQEIARVALSHLM